MKLSFPLPEQAVFILLIPLLFVSLLTLTPHSELIYISVQLIISLVIVSSTPKLIGTKYSWIRPYVLSMLTLSLYTPAGKLGLLLQPLTPLDSVLHTVDTTILGIDISQKIQPLSRQTIEIFSFFYAFFIPLIHFSLFLQFVGTKNHQREGFLFGFTILYSVSFLGYLFLAAKGPGAFPELHQHQPIQGGALFALIRSCIDASGGDLGAFPSLHVGATMYFFFSDLQRDPLRALLIIPIAVAIAGATVVLRFHYVTDLIVGTLLAWLCWRLAHWCQNMEKNS